MKCTLCNNENPDGKKICGDCGTALDPLLSQIRSVVQQEFKDKDLIEIEMTEKVVSRILAWTKPIYILAASIVALIPSGVLVLAYSFTEQKYHTFNADYAQFTKSYNSASTAMEQAKNDADDIATRGRLDEQGKQVAKQGQQMVDQKRVVNNLVLNGVPAPASTVEATMAAQKAMGRAIGIDVSQSDVKPDWTKIKNAGVFVAFIRSTMPSGPESKPDPDFSDNWSQAQKVGIVRGAYHVFQWRQDPEEQARVFAQVDCR